MSTEMTMPLAIPESTVVGTGSYSIPADKYGHINMTSSSTSVVKHKHTGSGGTNSQGASASSNNGSQWLVAGDSVSTSNTAPSTTITTTSTSASIIAYARVLINGTTNCGARSSIGGGTDLSSGSPTVNLTSSVEAGWSVAIYPIPKNNLPTELIEGN